MASENYRPDIDGLRAVAVLSVLFFHLGFASFPGGYVGVDVFFVISGFLITRLIRGEVDQTGSFDFAAFYLRRARRLLPALLFTLLVTAPAAYLLLSPPHLERYGTTLLHVLAFTANFHFWRNSGYFDPDADFEPLLHTWSLSVEEQFYLLWPCLLVLLLRKAPRAAVPWLVAAGGCSSLAASLVIGDGFGRLFADGGATTFYLMPFRAFQLAIGAVLVWLLERRRPGRRLRGGLVLLGLGTIAYAVLALTDQTPYSSANAVVPAIGAALVIYGGPSGPGSRLLAHRLPVAIGLISYSLYLVHWPVIVFVRYRGFRELEPTERWALVVATVLAATFMYRYVERPFRAGLHAARSRPALPFGRASAAATLLLVAFWGGIRATNGWASRYGEDLKRLVALGDRVTAEDLRTWGLGGCYLGGGPSGTFPTGFDASRCLRTDSGRRNVVVVGDSSAAHLMHGLRQVYADVNFIQITAQGCPPILGWKREFGCDSMLDFALLEFVKENIRDLHAVALIGRWKGGQGTFERLRDTLRRLPFIPRRKLIVFGDQLQFGGGLSAAVFWGRRHGLTGFLEHNRVKYEQTSNKALASLVAEHARFVEPHDYLCAGGCPFFLDAEQQDPLSRDGGHLTPRGSVLFAERLRAGGFEF